jgi:hypothetical protein
VPHAPPTSFALTAYISYYFTIVSALKKLATLLRNLAIALIMEAARTSETSVDIYLTTRQYIPEDTELQLN